MAKRQSTLPGRGTHWARAFIRAVALAAAVGVAGVAQAATSAAIVVDAKTGKVLYSSNADARAYPASLTKMMTLYLLFEALDSGKVSLSSRITMSAHAAAQPPSKLGLKPGQTIAVKDAILALVTRSANDVAAAIGEFIAGSESAFAVRMTAKARALGMKSTTFKNASGLPNSQQVTTARDMSILGRALRDRFPRYFAYFKTPSFTYGGRRIGNHNRLLGRVDGVDGIKTGYTRASGFNLVTSMTKGDRQLVAVVLGGKTGKERDQRMASLVGKYVGRASTGPQVAKIIVPNTTDVATAAAAGGGTVVASIPIPRPRADDSPAKTGSIAIASMLIASAHADVLDGEGDTDAGDDDMPAMPVNTGVRGWKIQIAATPTVESALALLDRARSKAPAVLGHASAYTEPVVKNSVTLYRARFAGFANKEAARSACDYLTKREFSCLALSE